MRLSKRRKRLLAAAVALLAFGLGLAAWGFVFEPNRLVVKERTLALPGWPRALDGLRVVVLADLHVGAPYVKEAKLRRLVSEVNGLGPDLVVMPGDFVSSVKGGRRVEPEVIAEILKDLRAALGVYAVLGNHDWSDGDGDRLAGALGANGVRVLENDAARVERGGQGLWLAGLSDLWMRRPDIDATLARVTDDAPVVAFTHNPDIFPKMPPRVALTLAGHTHGGQVCLPVFGRAVVPSEFGRRYAEGHVIEAGRHLYVSPGVGTSILPVRFRVPPEITLLTLRPAPSP